MSKTLLQEPQTKRASNISAPALVRVPWIESAVLLIVLLWALVPGWFTSQDPNQGVTGDKLLSPSFTHFFGTDHLGRDLFTRVIYGAEPTVLSALIAVSIGFVGGSLLGLIAGYVGGLADSIINGVLEVIMSIPGLLLAMIIVASFGYDTINTAIAVGVSAIATFGRLMRQEARQARSQLYVEAATVLGSRPSQTVFAHILPNSLTSVVSIAIVQFGSAILALSALAFLGYGSPPPASDWGLLVANGKDHLVGAPWLVFLPSLLIVAVVVSLSRVAGYIKERQV
ncbi:MAG: ABC transporter permease [Canibacter sp.]